MIGFSKFSLQILLAFKLVTQNFMDNIQSLNRSLQIWEFYVRTKYFLFCKFHSCSICSHKFTQKLADYIKSFKNELMRLGQKSFHSQICMKFHRQYQVIWTGVCAIVSFAWGHKFTENKSLKQESARPKFCMRMKKFLRFRLCSRKYRKQYLVILNTRPHNWEFRMREQIFLIYFACFCIDNANLHKLCRWCLCRCVLAWGQTKNFPCYFCLCSSLSHKIS